MLWRKWWLICLWIAGLYGKVNSLRKKVCIVGGGPGGLTAAKQLSMWPDEFEPVLFEKNSGIGGQWLYTDNTGVDEHGLPVHSSIFKNLRTNGPKQLMAFPDYQEFHGENRSYVKHETVLEYLKNYTSNFNLCLYIRLNTLVRKVELREDNKWDVQIRYLESNEDETVKCHAVMISTGNFYKPFIPNIAAIEHFKGKVIHSHYYRRPEDFANQTVVILGASFSGIDIAFEISPHAKEVYLSHRYTEFGFEKPGNMKEVRGVVGAENGNELILEDQTRIVADSLILCTGYLYEYPFLSSNTGIVVEEGKYVHPLYKHFINIEHPTMAILGLLHPGIPLQVLYVQSYYFTSLLRGKVTLPSYAEMMKDAELPEDKPKIKAHYMQLQVLDYYKELANASGADPLPPFFAKLSSIWLNEIIQHPMNFRENEFIIHGDGNVHLKNDYNDRDLVYDELSWK